MIRVTLKGLLGRKLRFVLTMLAIVVGTAMVSGAYVLTDTINASLGSLLNGLYANADAVVTGKAVFGGGAAPSFPASTLQGIEQLSGVAAAGGTVGAQVEIVGADGKVVSRGSALQLGSSIDPGYQRFTPFRLLTGRWPTGSGEVAIDAETAASQHYEVGDTISVIVKGGREVRYRLVGLVGYGNATSIAGDTVAIFQLRTAQALFHEQGRLDQIDISAKPNVPEATLLGEIRSVLPPHTRVRTGSAQTQQVFNDYSSAISTLRYFLLAFGGIALFVGAFVIANTLSITVAQRAREFATLRTLGASSRQIRRVVVLEGLLTGFGASTVGLLAGLGIAQGLEAFFRHSGLQLPLLGLVVAARTVIVTLVLGTLVTVAASLRPALRATRVPPLAAVREGSLLPPSRLARFGSTIALSGLAGGVTLVCVGVFVPALPTGPRLLLLAAGVLVLFLGVALVSPTITRPLVRVLGWPAAKIAGAAGTLARSNAMRNPARTAATAAALMIGLSLVTTVAVLAQCLKQSIVGSVRDEFRGNYVLTSQGGVSPTSIAPANALRHAGIATTVADERTGQGRTFGETIRVAGLDPGLSKLLALHWKQGTNATMAALGTRGAIVDKSFASTHHLATGSSLTLETPAGQTITLHLKGIYAPPQTENPLGTISISARTFDALYPNPQDIFTLIATPGGVTPASTAALNRVLASFPDAELQTEQQFIDSQQASITSELNLLYILLVLSIVVSLFGIVNTLVLTVFERTRELGMLRAVGMTRRQTRRMIRHEAVATTLLGATLGIPIGVGLAALFDHALHNIPFTIPWNTILIFLIAAILVGLVAAIFPARHAARLNILNALQYE